MSALTIEKIRREVEEIGALPTLPEIPMRIQILSKIVRTEVKAAKGEGEKPEITVFGVKFYYDPSDYSRDSYSYDRWELIRDFKENKHFREIHNSLNGLIGFLEHQTRE